MKAQIKPMEEIYKEFIFTFQIYNEGSFHYTESGSEVFFFNLNLRWRHFSDA